MSPKTESARGAGRDTAGATSVTMQIWYELNQAGEAGLAITELVEKVKPRVPIGYAWRRYSRAKRSSGRIVKGSTILPPADTPANQQRAVHYLIRQTTQNMKRDGTVLQRPDGRFAALRKPKYAYTDEQHDFDGSITRKQVALMEWLRVFRAIDAHIEEHPSKHLPAISKTFYAASKRLLDANTN